MSLDPVCSSKYGSRPLLDMPALDVAGAGAGGSWMPTNMSTMAPPPMYRTSPHDLQPLDMRGMQTMAATGPSTTVAPQLLLPNDWPYAASLPGSLFAPPPGPTPYRSPQVFPYSFLHMSPFTLQPPPYQMTDSSGQPLVGMGGLTQDSQQLAYLYPGVVDPLPPQGFGAFMGGLAPPGVVPQNLKVAEPKPFEYVFFEGVLTYGELSPVHGQDGYSAAYWKLPEFLRRELHATYGHVPATDVQVVSKNGEFHVYASPRRQMAWVEGGGEMGGERPGGRVVVAAGSEEKESPDGRLIMG